MSVEEVGRCREGVGGVSRSVEEGGGVWECWEVGEKCGGVRRSALECSECGRSVGGEEGAWRNLGGVWRRWGGVRRW